MRANSDGNRAEESASEHATVPPPPPACVSIPPCPSAVGRHIPVPKGAPEMSPDPGRHSSVGRLGSVPRLSTTAIPCARIARVQCRVFGVTCVLVEAPSGAERQGVGGGVGALWASIFFAKGAHGNVTEELLFGLLLLCDLVPVWSG